MFTNLAHAEEDFKGAVSECLKNMNAHASKSAYRTFQEYCTSPENLARTQSLAYNVEQNAEIPEGSTWARALKDISTTILPEDPRLSDHVINSRVYYTFLSRTWRTLPESTKRVFYAVSAIRTLCAGSEWVTHNWDSDHPESEALFEETKQASEVKSMSKNIGPLNVWGPFSTRALKRMGIRSEPGEMNIRTPNGPISVFSQSYTFTQDPSRRALFLRDSYYNVFFWITFPSNKEYREALLPMLEEPSTTPTLTLEPSTTTSPPRTPPHRITRRARLPPNAPKPSRVRYHSDLFDSVGSRLGTNYSHLDMALAISQLQAEGFVPNTYEGARDFEEQYRAFTRA
jgi:hypothetical protein